MFESAEAAFRSIVPAVDFCSARIVEETTEFTQVRHGVPEPPRTSTDLGAMITVVDRGGQGYASTADLTPAGLAAAARRATELAHMSAGRSVVDHSTIVPPVPRGSYRSPVADGADRLSIRDRFDLLATISDRTRVDARIVDSAANLWRTRYRQIQLGPDGARAEQDFDFLVPGLYAVAHDGGRTQTRSSSGRGRGFCRQGGLEILADSGFTDDAERVAHEALELVSAANCPDGRMDLVLMPDQMILQIHESIGHPLELDRILGDERNFAGTSFVTLEMFGHYRYGSELLDVTFDPTRPEQYASYAFDDDGSTAERHYLIRSGILQRPLGGALSVARARALRSDIEGVACTRATSWNRPPIDRMANVNVEPGASSLDDMIAAVDDGVLMHTNSSWSIDDSRNKFQFGCEYGRRIRHGKLAEVVRNPNYRGISATFWRSLAMVGNADTFEVNGTPYCGKGEPSQVIRVGHASPVCRFSGVDVFGGAD